MCFSVIYFCHISRSQCYILRDLCFCDIQRSRCLGNSVVLCHIFGSNSKNSTCRLDLKVFSKCSCVVSYIGSLDLIACVYCLSCYQAACIFLICFFYSISCLLILASCVRLITCPSVSCNRDWSLCDRQFFCSCYISIIVSFAGYSYIYSHTVFHFCCRDLCRILCPASICFLVFDLQIVSICICCCCCSCRICVSVIYFCHISRCQCYILRDLCFCDF